MLFVCPKCLFAQTQRLFYEQEIMYRQFGFYPPVWNLLVVMCTSEQEAVLEKMSEKLYFTKLDRIIKEKLDDKNIMDLNFTKKDKTPYIINRIDFLLKNKFCTFDKKKGNLIFKQGFSANTIHRMKKGEAINTKTIDALCYALDCEVSDIIEFIKE